MFICKTLTFSQTITNVTAQIVDKNVEVSYKLTSSETSQTFNITLWYGTSNKCEKQAFIVSGDVGENIKSGTKKIIWNYTSELAETEGNYYFKVKAEVVNENKTNTFTDARDSQIYNYLKIGTQTWMTENLAYLPSVTNTSSDAGYWVYNYSGTNVTTAKQTENYKKYGVLYNLETANKSCPTGWHLPSDAEWQILEKFIGISQANLEKTGWRGEGEIVNDNKINSVSISFGGCRIGSDGFDYINSNGFYWTSSLFGTSKAYYRNIELDRIEIYRNSTSKNLGYSVRCIKD